MRKEQKSIYLNKLGVLFNILKFDINNGYYLSYNINIGECYFECLIKDVIIFSKFKKVDEFRLLRIMCNTYNINSVEVDKCIKYIKNIPELNKMLRKYKIEKLLNEQIN